MKRYYIEIEGGGHWAGTYWSEQPKIYIVVDSKGGNDPIECDSHLQAKKLSTKLNRTKP